MALGASAVSRAISISMSRSTPDDGSKWSATWDRDALGV